MWLKNTPENKPENHQMVVKYWKNTNTTWVGKHIADNKHESFDLWLPLPDPNEVQIDSP